MENGKLQQLHKALDTFVIFNGVLDDSVVHRFCSILDSSYVDLKNYSEFVRGLYNYGIDFSSYLLKITLEDDNIYIRAAARGEEPDEYIREAVENELNILQQISRLTPLDFAEYYDYEGFLPKWQTTELDFVGIYKERLLMVGRYGYGEYAKSSMFIVRDGYVSPVKYPDRQRLSELYGYERERKAVLDNTLSLLEGKPAQNVLLYGDAGTGKSSTVKAIVNEYADRGLRLIEITKDQLECMPDIIESIGDNPLKFIIFIDDLSFAEGEDCFGALKAILEGSVSARGSNMVIYATSNRRHLVKESFSGREGDDVHRNDTMQENLSLSARFGLRVNFSRPDKKEYTAIAAELVRSRGIEISDEELSLKAEQFALSSGNGRSPRTAKQFAEQLLSSNDR